MRRVFIILPVKFAVRDVIHTPVLHHLRECAHIDFTLFTPDAQDKEFLAENGGGNIHWRSLSTPTKTRCYTTGIKGIIIWKWAIYRTLLFWLRGRHAFGTLVYRFNNRHQFAGHVQKSRLSASRKRREASAGNFVSALYGLPFPKSQRLFDIVSKAYHCLWDGDLSVEAIFEETPPQAVVVAYPQNHKVRPYRLAARRRSIPEMALVGSWDKLTTKGPLGPDFAVYIVGSRAMLKELERYHGIGSKSVKVIGWPKMDCFKQRDLIVPREAFLRSIGVPSNHKLILFAGNSPRLGPGEPKIVRHLAQQVRSGGYRQPCSLAVRPHPKDHLWEERFASVTQDSIGILFKPEHGRIEFLANLLFHTDVLVATQGSICLDAIAVNTCVVNIAYDAVELDSPHESIKNWYALDHYQPIVKHGATRLVENSAQLDAAICAYLNTPDMDASERKDITDELLEPFDGKASERLVQSIIAMSLSKAPDHTERTLATGHEHR